MRYLKVCFIAAILVRPARRELYSGRSRSSSQSAGASGRHSA